LQAQRSSGSTIRRKDLIQFADRKSFDATGAPLMPKAPHSVTSSTRLPRLEVVAVKVLAEEFSHFLAQGARDTVGNHVCDILWLFRD
jgi:hypothetical protein